MHKALEDDLRNLRNQLPNFPEEIIEAWLAPFVKDIGWPPGNRKDIHNRWRYILSRKGLAFWSAIDWELTDYEFSFKSLDNNSRETVNYLIEGYFKGQPNFVTVQLTDGKERIRSLGNYISQHGVWPVPIVVMSQPGGLRIIDGNHRATTLLVYKQFREAPEYADIFTSAAPMIRERQLMWIGCHPHQQFLED